MSLSLRLFSTNSNKITIRGRGRISAKIIADSLSPAGVRLTTLELEYPRFAHAEFMTHRVFSRNAASSRAIPVNKMVHHVKSNMAKPIHWGKNQKGMQAEKENSEYIYIRGKRYDANFAWIEACDRAVEVAQAFSKANYHKQIVNRLIEPFQMIKVICTATEFDNFFTLRDHSDAQPEIRELAICMREAMNRSIPIEGKINEWHLPYIDREVWDDCRIYSDSIKKGKLTPLEVAKRVSASCCAQVSYRSLDRSIPKALIIYEKLVESVPFHASPFEHQATPFVDPNKWGGNFRGWSQYRQEIEKKIYGVEKK